jgi:hypothetical protein
MLVPLRRDAGQRASRVEPPGLHSASPRMAAARPV